MIIITSKQGGFRRCGVVHPATPTEYHDDHFTPEELTVLQAESMLTVVVSVEPGEAGPLPADRQTVAQLTEALTALKIDIPNGAKKADLVQLYLAATSHAEK